MAFPVVKYNKPERIGRLRERIQIHFATETVNDYGERVRAWAGLGTFWANVEYNQQPKEAESGVITVSCPPLSASFWANVEYNQQPKEAESGGQDTVMTRVMFTMRYNTDVSELQRVFYSGRLYDIETISISVDRQYMTLTTNQYGYFPGGAPDAEFSVGAVAYTEDFTGPTIDTGDNSVTVTVYGGLLPVNTAQIFVFYNGQYITQYTHSGSKITMDFDVIATDLITVTFFP